MMIFSGVIGIAAAGFATGLLFGIITALLLRRRTALRRASAQSVTRFMYSGNLKQTNLLDAIQFLELGRREGVLHIYAGRRKGYITFAMGQVVDAFFRNAPGKEAVFEMLELDYGDFYFESKTISQPKVITESIMNIALEWDARRNGDAFDGGEGTEDAPSETVPAPESAQTAAAERATAPEGGTAVAAESTTTPKEPEATSGEATNSGSEKT
jgi:hypothetical protein